MRAAVVRSVVVCGVLGCGSVERSAQDAATGDDAPLACTVHDTIASCGATCARCPAADDRSTPICDGTACGVACSNAAPSCTDGSCSRLTWSFDSNQLDGITLQLPAGATAAVRNHAGNVALAVPVTDLQTTETRLTVPVCVTGTTQLQTKTLSATIYLEGGNDTGDQYYVQAAVPAPMTGAYLAQRGFASNGYYMYSAPISASQFANTATTVVLQIGSLGTHFTGTVWVDDIKIQ